MYKVCEDTFYVFNPRFDGFLHIFFDVEDYGKESKVHCDLVFPEVAKTVDGDEVGLLVTCKPDEVNVPEQQFLYPTTGVDCSFNVSSTDSEQSKLCINSPLHIDARLLWK